MIFESHNQNLDQLNLLVQNVLSKKTNITFPTLNIDETNNHEIIGWGKNNKFPKDILNAYDSCDVLQNAIHKKAASILGNGFFLFKKTTTVGKDTIEVVRNAEIEDFFDSCFFEKQMLSFWVNRLTYGLGVPRFIFDNKRNITSFDVITGGDCRLSEKRTTLGKSQKLYWSYNWNNFRGKGPYSEKDLEKIKVLDTLNPLTAYSQIITNPKISQWVMPTSDILENSRAYSVLPWHNHISTWIELYNKYPEIVFYLYKNAMIIDKVMYVNEDFWSSKMLANNLDKDGKEINYTSDRKAREKYLQNLSDKITSPENSNKSLALPTKFHQVTGNEQKLITIDDIKYDATKFSTIIEQIKQAESRITSAVGLDSAITGNLQPNVGYGTRSGSDKREAFNILNVINNIERIDLKQIFNLIKKVNGWDKDICIGIKTQEFTTLDLNPTGSQNVTAQ